MLEIQDLTIAYDELRVINGISFTVQPGEVMAIFGRNSAGKTTTLNCIAGLIHPTSGRIIFEGQDITLLPAHKIASLGVALVPEGRRLFPTHTVRENLELGAYQQLRRGKIKQFNDSVDEVCRIFPRISERLEQPAGLLSGGEQQMVAIARALVGRPKLLLLDEPSLGLSPVLATTIFDTFSRLNARGMTILLVEQMVAASLNICNRALVLQDREIVLAGTSKDLFSEQRVLEAYLGTPISTNATHI